MAAEQIEGTSRFVIEDVKDEQGKLIGYIETITRTTTITTYKNARSDTDFRANLPNPGRKVVEVIVEQENIYHDINDLN